MDSDEEEFPIDDLINKNSTLDKQQIKKSNDIDKSNKRWLNISPYIEWFRSRFKTFILFALAFSTILFTAAICVIVWNFMNHSLMVNDDTLVAHNSNQMDLYKSDDGIHVPLPKDDIIAESDVDDTDQFNDISEPNDVDPDKPTYTKAEMDELNLEAENDIVSHNDILHDDPFDELGQNDRHDNTDERIPLSKHKGFLEALRMDHDAIADRIKGDKDKVDVTPLKLITEPIEILKATSSPSIGIIESNIFDNHSMNEEKQNLLAKAVEISPVINKNKESNKKPPVNPHPTKKFNQLKKPTDENAKTRQSTASPTEVLSDGPVMTLYKVTNAVRAGAVCLDGSPPAYYHRPGTGNSEKLWILHFNGGAWCFDAKACFDRAKSSLGSTKKLPPAPPIIQGINSPDPSINPDFYDWNLVWVVYCDGASFTGNREKPLVSDKGEIIYMRGKRVLNAIINDLLYNRNFKLAEAIILTGSSAGSMTAIFQADYIASKFPRTVPVRVLSDAGFFIETAPMGGKNLGAMFRQIFQMQNSSAGLNQDCVRETGLEKGWQCFFPSRTLKYVKTPMFVLNAAYDIWALIYFLDIDCKFPNIGKDNRKKRSVIQSSHLRTDSELDMELSIDEKLLEESLFAIRKRRNLDNTPVGQTDLQSKRNNLHNRSKRMRRDISGFEMLPFFRSYDTEDDGIHSSEKNKITKITAPTYRSLKANNLTTTRVFNHTNKRNRTSTPITKKLDFHHVIKDFAKVFNINNINRTSHQYQNHRKKSIVLNRSHILRNADSTKNITNKVLRQRILSNETMLPKLSRHNISTNHRYNLSFSKLFTSTNHQFYNKSNQQSPAIKQYKQVIQGDHSFQNFFNSELQSAKLKHIYKKRTPPSQKPSTHSGEIKDVKRQGVKRPSHKSTKWRRSTSIAREYINILRSDPPECTEKEIFNAMKYRNAMIHATSNLLRLPKSGRFLVSCIDHSLSLFDETWTSLTVAGKSIQQAFGDWFYERGNKSKYDSVDCPYPCNPTCP